MNVKYSTGKPPYNLYNRCRDAFGKGVDWEKGVIFTYGDTVYCKFDLPEDLKIHETTHVVQQEKMGAEAWWEQYLIDPKFRLLQEAEAYKNQLVYIRKYYNRKHRKEMEQHIYYSLANLYGFKITEEEAEKILR